MVFKFIISGMDLDIERHSYTTDCTFNSKFQSIGLVHGSSKSKCMYEV